MPRLHKIKPLFEALLVPGLLLLFLGLPAPGLAQLPPDEAWRTLETEHFRVTYPHGLMDLAQRVGERAETAWDLLSRELPGPPKGKVDIALSDHADVSNGFARVHPSNRIYIYAPPPVDGFDLAHMDEWMELVVLHELVHIFHQDYPGKVGGIVRKVFGRYPLEWPFFPAAAAPDWTVEGIAVYFESSLTRAGRVRGSYHEMAVRTAVLEDRFESIDQASGDSPVWPGGQRYYIYGSLFLQHLTEVHGEEALARFVQAVAGQWVPYRLDAAAREAFGISFSRAWEEWHGALRIRYEALRDSLAGWAPLTRGEALDQGGYYSWNPAPSPDGGLLAYARVDGRSDPQIRVLPPEGGEGEKLTRTNSLSNLSWTPSGEVLFSQVDYLDSYRLRGDLFLARRDGGVVRVTRGGRLDHPHVEPGGRRAVAVQEEGGTNRLVLVDLPGGDIHPLTPFDPSTHWSYPRWSPDGRWIAAARWRPGAYFDVVLLDAQGTVRQQITRDRAVDTSPAWSADGRWLLWASDRSRIPNLYAVEVDPDSGEPGPLRQITNVLGGVAFPAVDPQGRWLYFSSYHAEGWRIERIPFRPGEWLDPSPLHPGYLADVDPTRYDRRVDAPQGPYRAARTLRPTYWSPAFREGDAAGGVEVLKPGFGLETAGWDLVERHRFALSGTFSSGFGTFNGGGSYTFSGLGNPLLSAAVTQFHEADPRALGGVTQAGDTVPLYLVERERAASLGATFQRRRARTLTAFSLAGSLIREDRTLLEEDLTETRRFNLLDPDTRLLEGRASLSFANARIFPFSIGREDGVNLYLRARVRREVSLADSLRSLDGKDRSYRDLVGQASAFKGFRGPGFGNHVLAVRGSWGVASGPGADSYHFEVGGSSGQGLPVSVGSLGQSLLFPVRGYDTAERFGRYGWSATAEYRFPLGMLNRGPGLLPLHLGWLSGAVFLDGGNAWGPAATTHGHPNPARDALLSVGGEVTLRVLALWFSSLDLRLGLARPLVDGDGLQAYLRLGPAF